MHRLVPPNPHPLRPCWPSTLTRPKHEVGVCRNPCSEELSQRNILQKLVHLEIKHVSDSPGGLLSTGCWVVPGYLVQDVLGWLGPKHLHSGRLSGVLLARAHIWRYAAFSSAPFPLEHHRKGGWRSFDETRNLGCQVIFFFRKLNCFSRSNGGLSLRIPAHAWVDLEKKGGPWLCLSLWCPWAHEF